ncbi:hypothetical protein CDD83_4772 [Cordyceps sp. RAO-2017]|nr:hypothetical protein CDD83_4772 [Cordyceps sp. RAO-2017]
MSSMLRTRCSGALAELAVDELTVDRAVSELTVVDELTVREPAICARGSSASRRPASVYGGGGGGGDPSSAR